jgi:hypothetical protein
MHDLLKGQTELEELTRMSDFLAFTYYDSRIVVEYHMQGNRMVAEKITFYSSKPELFNLKYLAESKKATFR